MDTEELTFELLMGVVNLLLKSFDQNMLCFFLGAGERIIRNNWWVG